MKTREEALPTALELRRLSLSNRSTRRSQALDERALRQRELAERRPEFLRSTAPADAVGTIRELLRRAAQVGVMRADVFHFPSEFCTDGARALNNGEPHWPETLQGLAASYFSLLRVQFRPLGFVIGAEIVTWPQLMPGDVALFLTWQDAPADS